MFICLLRSELLQCRSANMGNGCASSQPSGGRASYESIIEREPGSSAQRRRHLIHLAFATRPIIGKTRSHILVWWHFWNLFRLMAPASARRRVCAHTMKIEPGSLHKLLHCDSTERHTQLVTQIFVSSSKGRRTHSHYAFRLSKIENLVHRNIFQVPMFIVVAMSIMKSGLIYYVRFQFKCYKVALIIIYQLHSQNLRTVVKCVQNSPNNI